MLTREPTKEMIEEWKNIFAAHRHELLPNRKTGVEVDAYFRNKYQYQCFSSPEFTQIIEENIKENDYTRTKLKGLQPQINTYCVDNVLVGIDLTSGEFHVESEDTEKMTQVYDDLFVFRGLDEYDISNFFLVAEYITLASQKSPI